MKYSYFSFLILILPLILMAQIRIADEYLNLNAKGSDPLFTNYAAMNGILLKRMVPFFLLQFQRPF